MRQKNPKHGTFKKPEDYTDLGWQLMPNHPVLSECRIKGHKREEYDNSLFMHRGTHVIYICHSCKYIYNIDMSD